jgi:hypothetical protein
VDSKNWIIDKKNAEIMLRNQNTAAAIFLIQEKKPRPMESIEDEENSNFRNEDNTIPKAKRKSQAMPKVATPMDNVETKKKRPQTEAQKASTVKMLAALKAKREATKKAQEEEAEMLKAEKDELKIQEKQRERLEKAKLQKRKLPPPSERPTYVTAAELQKFKLEMMELTKSKPIIREKEVEVAKVVEKPVIVEKIIEKEKPKIISGNDLLDRIFFSK